jgi:hypothetical protein
VSELLSTAKRSADTVGGLAAKVHLSPSTVSRWKKGATPRLLHVLLLGDAVERRLEWVPRDTEWPGADHVKMAEPPLDLPFMTRRARANLQWQEGNYAYRATFDAHFLAAEARWARIYTKCWSLDECPGDRGTWSTFENGPIVWDPAEDKDPGPRPRRHKSSPLPSVVFIGRQLGLDLAWTDRSAPYRVPPWQVTSTRLPRTAGAALKQEQRRRPRLF